MISKRAETVWVVLAGSPIEVVDEDQHSVWSSQLWELVTPRLKGDYSGKRTIGSANIVAAYNILHMQLLESDDTISLDSLETFKHVLKELQDLKLIRKRPEQVRSTFSIVR